MKTILAEHDGIHARIVEERSDIGWTLHILLPTGRSKDHLQDTKDIALSQAEDDYHIPRESWRDAEIIYIRLLNEGTDVWRPLILCQSGTVYTGLHQRLGLLRMRFGSFSQDQSFSVQRSNFQPEPI